MPVKIITEVLFKEKVNCNLQDQKGWTALMYASDYSHYQVIEFLLKANADPSIQIQNGMTALMIMTKLLKFFSNKMLIIIFKHMREGLL